ncbi:MAG: hypothetical protein ACE5G7_04695 [Candidatus Hydrothermarchaeaceae archaeon]
MYFSWKSSALSYYCVRARRLRVEATEPFRNTINYLSRPRLRFSRLSSVLFIIFAAMVFSQIAVILS